MSSDVQAQFSGSTTARLGVFDSIRGFSMFLVVLGHVLLYMNLGLDHTPLSSFIITFRMPLFFFISGYFAYKPLEKWTAPVMASIMQRKVKAQIFCTLVFFTLFALYSGTDPLGWTERGFGGYWFTIVLFQIFVMYIISVVLARLLHSATMSLVLMLTLAVILTTISLQHPGDYTGLPRILSWLNLTRYTQFFVFGLFARRCAALFPKALANNYFRAASIIIFFSLLTYSHLSRGTWMCFFVTEVPLRYSALLCLLIVFTSHTAYFSSEARPARILRFIGQRTLDIYMIHYFFLPHMQSFGAYIADPSMTVVQLFVCGTIAAVIVAICLVFSSLLRSSPLLAQWLFGVRKPAKSAVGDVVTNGSPEDPPTQR